MKITNLKTKENLEIIGPKLITPDLFKDERGFFFESWNKALFEKNINKETNFVQDNHSKSKYGVLRGLHYQLEPYSQGKLVRCIKGEIFDVIVDLRKDSETFCCWSGVYLGETNFKMLWIPSGFAHGFLTMSKYAEITYKTTDYWKKEFERSILWNDIKVGIKWPIDDLNLKYPIMSKKDAIASTLEKAIKNSEIYK